MTKYLIAAGLAFTFATSAFAQTTEYYVVQDSATKKCTIVDKKPTTTTMVQVGPMAGWRWNLHRTAKASATAKTFGTAWFISRLIKV